MRKVSRISSFDPNVGAGAGGRRGSAPSTMLSSPLHPPMGAAAAITPEASSSSSASTEEEENPADKEMLIFRVKPSELVPTCALTLKVELDYEIAGRGGIALPSMREMATSTGVPAGSVLADNNSNDGGGYALPRFTTSFTIFF